jgi:hypothetical protein
MALDFVDLTIDATGGLTVPTDTTTIRVGGVELSWLQHDSTHRDSSIRNYNVIPNTGSADSILQIFGGHPGTHICLRPKLNSYEITLIENAFLFLPTGTITLTASSHCVYLVCVGTDLYAKPI